MSLLKHKFDNTQCQVWSFIGFFISVRDILIKICCQKCWGFCLDFLDKHGESSKRIGEILKWSHV